MPRLTSNLAPASLRLMVGAFLFACIALIGILGSTDAALTATTSILGSDWRPLVAVAIALSLLLAAISASMVGLVFWSLLYSRSLSRDERLRLFRSVYPSGSFSRLGEVVIHCLR